AYPHVVDEDGCGLTWPAETAASSTAPAPSSPVASHASVREPRANTPQHLVEKILTSRTALEGERKQVTVLFADVSGFTAISEKLDPEEVHQLMTRAFELMLGEVHRYEGTINQFLGDGVMALFGAPIAHEDHTQRAVHAALGMQRVLQGYGAELQRTQGITFRVRLGLNTGLVVVASIGDNLRMDYTAVGDTTNLAARMLSLAAPGQIVIAEDTHRVVSGYFVTRPLGAQVIKGKAEPVNAYEVVRARGLRTRLEVGAERGLTPFVGREHELTLLQERWAEARAGRGQVIWFCRKVAFLRPHVKIVSRKINDLRASTFLFSVICDRTPQRAFLELLSTFIPPLSFLISSTIPLALAFCFSSFSVCKIGAVIAFLHPRDQR